MQPVNSLNENDVLFGRGMAASMYVGTQNFRDLCEPHKSSYQTATKHSQKAIIAQAIVNTIRSKGGRFLKLDESVQPVQNSVKEGVWYEVTDEREVMEKTRQALRQNNSLAKRAREKEQENMNASFVDMTPQLSSMDTSSTQLQAPTGMNPLLSLPTIDPRLLLFYQASSMNAYSQQALFIQQQQQQVQLMQQLATAVNVPFSYAANVTVGALPLLTQQQQQQRDDTSLGVQPVSKEQPLLVYPRKNVSSGDHIVATDTTVEAENLSNETSFDMIIPSELGESKSFAWDKNENGEEEEEDSRGVIEFLLSILQLSGLPRFTDHAAERASMSNDEKAAVLSDMFGKYCNVDTQTKKKARRDLDAESIAFLVNQMREEIKRIPLEKKEALLEAQEKCRPEEFRNERLVHFLRCAEMDAQLAAKRFVTYWQKRREVFGPDKYVMRMAVGESICDDQVALGIGWLRLLPKLDSSGRQLLLLNPACHDKEGYSSESLLRAVWYIIEVTSRAITDIDSSVVVVVWGEDSTVWDFDPWLYQKFYDFELTCWPCKFDCFHACSATKFILRVVCPTISAFQSKKARARTVWHDVPKDQILSVLEEYGITRDMLPTECGGSIQQRQSDWIANRRAIEMEEI